MHITIISAFPLQTEWLIKQFKDTGLSCTHLNLNESAQINYRHTDAIFFPHLTKEPELQKLEIKTLITKQIPLLFLGKAPKNYPEELLPTSVFLPDQLEIHELCLITKDLMGRNYKQRYRQKVQLGEYSLQRDTRTLTFKEQEIRLTKKEFHLLELLVLNLGQITTRRHIVNYVWDSRSFVSPNTIDVYISRLRKKLRGLRSSIRTINSLGYELILPTTH